MNFVINKMCKTILMLYLGILIYFWTYTFCFSGSNDKSVIIWDVKGELNLNSKLKDSLEVSIFYKILHFCNLCTFCTYL